MENKTIPSCPKCNSTWIVTRVDGSRYCRKCGTTFDSSDELTTSVIKACEECPKCGRRQNYFRKKSGEHVCIVCGHIWEKVKENV